MSSDEEKLKVLRETFDGEADFYGLAKRWRDEGMSQMDLCLLFLGFYVSVNNEDSPRVDRIADALDGIYSGWGNREWYLFEKALTNEEIWAEEARRRESKGSSSA